MAVTMQACGPGLDGGKRLILSRSLKDPPGSHTWLGDLCAGSPLVWPPTASRHKRLDMLPGSTCVAPAVNPDLIFALETKSQM